MNIEDIKKERNSELIEFFTENANNFTVEIHVNKILFTIRTYNSNIVQLFSNNICELSLDDNSIFISKEYKQLEVFFGLSFLEMMKCLRKHERLTFKQFIYRIYNI